jgi:hypothetical protein
VNELKRFHYRVKQRCHRQRALKKILAGCGIVVPRSYPPRGEHKPGTLYCVEALQRLVDEFGAEHVTLALRLIVETSDENAACLRPSVIAALTMLVARHEYGQLGLSLFDAMDRVDIAAQLAFARELRRPAIKTAWHQESDILLGLLASELRRHLGELA